MIKVSGSQAVLHTPKIAILLPGLGNSIEGSGFYGAVTSQSIRGNGFYGETASQSIRGDGFYGAVTSQSTRGGGSAVPSYPYVIAAVLPQGVGMYFKVASLPASDMTLFDASFAVLGYARIKLTSAGNVVWETAFASFIQSVDSGLTVVPGEWYWVSGDVVLTGSAALRTQLICVAPGGVTPGLQSSGDDGLGLAGGTLSSVIGFGESVSSSYLDFPNTAGNQLSKMIITQNGYRPTPPIVDWVAAANNVTWYNCRQALGATATLTDDSGGGIDLAAGTLGMTVVLNGPFV